ncbi:MAG: hypothetical protein B6U76_03085 [Desulfurococcales archaeon ex4484_217_2]|nr:MAG: hypothetical protein B6U76_03085 [Desulfurococcales archaeon ex4484_217_2]
MYLTFEREVELRRPKAVMSVDINFNNITFTITDLEGRLITMGTTSFSDLKRALTHRIIAEKLQRRYVKGIKESIRKHGRRAKIYLMIHAITCLGS